MSYDAGLWINTGITEAEVVDCGNYTYNVWPMLELAFPEMEGKKHGINWLEGMSAHSCCWHLCQAIKHMEDNEVLYYPLRPANNWGSYEGCLKWLRNILSHCEQHPLATLRIT